MTLMKRFMLGTATAALLSAPLATGGALAQTGTGGTQEADTGTNTQGTGTETEGADTGTGTQDTGTAATQQSGQTDGQQDGQQQDSVVATVDGEEIRTSDIMTLIGILPPEVASQPPEMLVPMAMEQLILRELILQQARGQNLDEDPEVMAIVESSSAAAEEDAMVQVWINREMENRVTDEAVQQVYSDLQANSQQEIPPLEQVRPQIEQHVRQQQMRDLALELREGADIVLFDPSGRQIESGNQAGSGNTGGGAQADENAATGNDAGTDDSGETQDN